jgi:hypothetical protein
LDSGGVLLGRPSADRDVNLHVPEALHDDLALLARMDRRALSE